MILGVYHQLSAKGSRPPFPLAAKLIEPPCTQRFAGIDMIFEWISDEIMIVNFCLLLEEHRIGAQIFEVIKQTLKEQCSLLLEVTILDATTIHAPSSTLTWAKPECAGGTRARSLTGPRWASVHCFVEALRASACAHDSWPCAWR